MELGPMRLNLIAERGGRPHLKAALRAAERAVQALCEVSACWGRLKKPALEVEAEGLPHVARLMVEACKATGDPTLTPMAAVAGAISDVAAEEAWRLGAEKVVAENRGDIALKLSRGLSATIGVKASIQAEKHGFTIRVDGGSGVGGVATSGLGGMGLTKGFASAAVALAPTGALADACSTILGNATTASGAPVEWRLAEEVDPLTDLRGQPVTYRVGSLPERVKIEAVRNGVRKVWELRRKGLLHGGIIVVGEFYALSPENIAKVEDENLRRVA